MLFLIITIVIVGVCVYSINQLSVLPAWAKWLINAIANVGTLVYAASVLFGYRFPGMR